MLQMMGLMISGVVEGLVGRSPENIVSVVGVALERNLDSFCT